MFPDMPTEEEIKRDTQRWQQKFEEIGALENQMKEVRGTGTAEDGKVEVVAAPGGLLLEVNINPRAMRLGSEALGEAIIEASRAAAADATSKLNAILQPILGSDNGVMSMLSANNAFEMPQEMKETLKGAADIFANMEEDLSRLRQSKD
ncbi:YbaB/EbfC DNA-binding family protein [Actinomadura pelletieri DSM 43383]|uniref:YbaB/EbfC DNA-binding family protein n=1 Tax=Actinomadura pelletieri DSM 43383 TaxID=1120940 RepID=A0A495QGS0_9ACTN|nr:YbaB/EbfC family nucleoid-associated protein [Actinomadura pelletieri]RKS71112.1 YbaB/EbfC DNA-binding family protein [Actinomadura pelletieri DSM 43383]